MRRSVPLLVTMLVVLPAGEASSQAERGPEFHASAVTYRSPRNSSLTAVDVFVSIAHNRLLFTRSGGEYEADYDIGMHLIGPRGEAVFDERVSNRSTTPLYEETLTEEIMRVQRFGFEVPAGRYELVISVRDRKMDETASQSVDLEVPAYPRNALGVSGLLLADYLGSVGERELPPGAIADLAEQQAFIRNGHAYLPNTTGRYVNFAPSLLAYYEVYGLNPLRQSANDRLYRVEYFVENNSGEAVLYYMRTHEKPGYDSYNTVEINIQDLNPGPFRLTVSVTDLGSGNAVSSSREFLVMDSYLGLAERDYDQAVNQLRYTATERELKILREADTDQRLRLFREFWMSRDPTPRTKRNETLIEYYRRIAYANEHFGLQNQAGWATDRGMVYITMGLPDQVEREDMSLTSRPVEVWIYNQYPLRLIFDDPAGFGDYRLRNRQEYFDKVRLGRGW
jgi:GWxTD domain-containing protein